MAADRFGEADERSEAAACGFADEPVDQDRDVLEREAGLEDSSQRFLEGVGAPYLAAGGAQASERSALSVVEAVGCFEQRPAGVLEPSGGFGVVELAELVPVGAAHVVQRPIGERDEV